MIQVSSLLPIYPSAEQINRNKFELRQYHTGSVPRSRCEPASMSAVASVLPKFHITKRRQKQLESIALIREQRERGKQELAFHARPFVLCGIPLRPLPKDQLAYKRRNGKFFLHIVGHPDFGLPFGQDRLIPIWVATLALRQKSRTIHFRSAAQILDFFRLPKDGRYYRRMAQGFQRIFAATIFFGTEDQPTGNRLIDWTRFHFFDQIHLWFTGGKGVVPIQPAKIGTLSFSARLSTTRLTSTVCRLSGRS